MEKQKVEIQEINTGVKNKIAENITQRTGREIYRR